MNIPCYSNTFINLCTGHDYIIIYYYYYYYYYFFLSMVREGIIHLLLRKNQEHDTG
ncbi:MAG: hypothetical protein K7J15_03235 [Candidatus Regiella insecticola]|nr:hypothetical protein [Candidatus Regiella insecticola]